MLITRATSEDYKILTEITKMSKAYWGYSDELMDTWSDALTITNDYIDANHVYNLLIGDLVGGYYSYFYTDENSIKLDYLFVLPKYIGKGIGKKLMNDFLKRVKTDKHQKITVDSDPNAEKFYEKIGFVKVGQIETSIKDRFLPIMQLEI